MNFCVPSSRYYCRSDMFRPNRKSSKFKRSLGIELDSTFVQMAMTPSTLSGLPECVSISLPEKLFSAGVLIEPLELRDSILPAVTSKTFERVVLNIPAQWVNAYFLVIDPMLSASELELVIELDINDRFNLDRSNYYRDYAVFSGIETRALIFICAKPIIDSRIAALKLLQLDPQQVTTTYSVMAQQLAQKTAAQTELMTSAMLYVELGCINVVVISQEQILFLETIGLLGETVSCVIMTVTRTLREQYGEKLPIHIMGSNLLVPEMKSELVHSHGMTEWSFAQSLVESAA